MLPVTPILAQDSETRILEEIIVTAQYREQGLQDVPISIMAVTADVITSTVIQKVEDIQFLVPNLTITETGISTNTFIRGIGSGVNQGFEQSVGTYIDGIYFGRGQQFRAPFLDIERIEVLRGPQSILFGKNSVAGALNITTARPTQEFEGRAMVSKEFEDDETILELTLSGPLSDRVRGRLAARTRDSDGYMRNATLNRNEPEREDWTIRGLLEFDVSDNLMATVKVEVGEFDVHGRHVEIVNEKPATAGPFTGLMYNQILGLVFGQDASVFNVTQDEIRSSNGDFSFNKSDTFSIKLDWTTGDFEIESLTAYNKFKYDEFCDCDFTGANVFEAALQEEYSQFSQELRLTSPLGGNFDYIAGLYYQTSEHEYGDQIIVPANSILVPAVNGLSPGAGDLLAGTEASRLALVDADVFSVFAQLNWHLSDVHTLQVGGRITNDKRDGSRTLSVFAQGGGALPGAQFAAPIVYANAFGITSTNLAQLGPTGAFFQGKLGSLPVSGSRDVTKFSPDVKLVWDVNDTSMYYASWSRGFKSGGFDFRANNRNFYADMATSFEYDDEEATNIEFGGKFTLADGAAELNATVFLTDFDNLQISIFDGTLGFNVGNAASAEIAGLEVDGRWAVSDYVTVSGGFAITDFEFTDFKNGQCYFGQAPDIDLDGDGIFDLCDYTGNSNQMVSDFQANLAINYGYPLTKGLELSALIFMFYTSEYDASATFDPALVQDSYSKFNLRIGIGPPSGDWEVALLARNLTDEKVLQFGGDTPLAGGTFGAKSNYAFYGQGRTLWLQATKLF
jgi:outer membrane receptor protein involved in Fe transport